MLSNSTYVLDEREYARQYWHKRRQSLEFVVKERARQRNNKKIRKMKYKTLIDSYKKGCLFCPEYVIYCLEFHHVGEKEFTISDALNQNISIERLIEEIKKCIVVCRNCHAKIHSGYNT